MNPTTMYLEQSGFLRELRRNALLDGISDAESRWRPQPDIPPIVWHVMHLSVSEACAFLGRTQGRWDVIGDELIARFSMGATLPEDPTALPVLSEAWPEVDRLRAAVEEALASFSEAELAAPFPHSRDDAPMPEFIQTPLDALGILSIHESHHNGEISLLRRLVGKPGFVAPTAN